MESADTFADEAERTRPQAVPPRVWSATGLQVLGRIWGSGCTLAGLFLLSRRLDSADFGRYTFYLAIFHLLDALVNLGTSQVAVQRTAGDPSAIPGVLSAARRIRLASGALGVLLVGGGAFAMGEKGAIWILLATLYPVTHVFELSATIFRNRIDWRIPVRMRAIASGLSLSFLVTLLWLGVDEPAPFLLAVASGSATANFLLHAAARPHLPKVSGPVRPTPGIFHLALPLGLSGICSQAYFYGDVFFVRALEGETALGHYNLAVRFMAVVIMIAQYTSLAALPWFSRRHAAGELGPAIARIGQPLFAAAGFCAGLLVPHATVFLELFREGFGVAGPSLRWLFGAGAVIYAGSMVLTGVVATGNTRTMLKITAAGLVLNLAANAVFIPRFGIEGAGATTFATEAFVAIAAALALRKIGAPLPGGRSLLLWLLGPAAFLTAWALSSFLSGLLGLAT